MTCLFQHKIDVGLMLFHGIRASCVGGGGGLTTHPKPNRLPQSSLFCASLSPEPKNPGLLEAAGFSARGTVLRAFLGII